MAIRCVEDLYGGQKFKIRPSLSQDLRGGGSSSVLPKSEDSVEINGRGQAVVLSSSEATEEGKIKGTIAYYIRDFGHKVVGLFGSRKKDGTIIDLKELYEKLQDGILGLDELEKIWGYNPEDVFAGLNAFGVDWGSGITEDQLATIEEELLKGFEEDFYPLLQGTGVDKGEIFDVESLGGRLYQLAEKGELTEEVLKQRIKGANLQIKGPQVAELFKELDDLAIRRKLTVARWNALMEKYHLKELKLGMSSSNKDNDISLAQLYREILQLQMRGQLTEDNWNVLMKKYGLKKLKMNNNSFAAFFEGRKGIAGFIHAFYSLRLTVMKDYPPTGHDETDEERIKKYHEQFAELCAAKHFKVIDLDKLGLSEKEIFAFIQKQKKSSLSTDDYFKACQEGKFGDDLQKLADLAKDGNEFTAILLGKLQEAIYSETYSDYAEQILSPWKGKKRIRAVLDLLQEDSPEDKEKRERLINEVALIWEGKKTTFDYEKVMGPGFFGNLGEDLAGSWLNPKNWKKDKEVIQK